MAAYLLTILFALTIVFTLYGLLISIVHMPFLGAFFLIPLSLCIMMGMLMDHNFSKHHTHTAYRI